MAALFARWGATIIDADAIVRELQQPGHDVFKAIVATFGRKVLRADGAIDRAALRTRVLADSDARAQLESIVHPAVEARRDELFRAAQARGDSVVVVEMPLLFEATDPAVYDGIIVVDAPLAERRRRLMQDRNLPGDVADALIAAQWPAERKRALATWTIDNDANRAVLEMRARAVWQEINH